MDNTHSGWIVEPVGVLAIASRKLDLFWHREIVAGDVQYLTLFENLSLE